MDAQMFRVFFLFPLIVSCIAVEIQSKIGTWKKYNDIPIVGSTESVSGAAGYFSVSNEIIFTMGATRSPQQWPYIMGNGTFLFSLKTKKWKRVADVPNKDDMVSNSAVAVINDKLFVVGGRSSEDDRSRATQTTLIYNRKLNRWSYGPKPPKSVWNAGGCAIGNKMYVVGGEETVEDGGQIAQIWELDTKKSKWTVLNTVLPVDGTIVKAACVNNKVYALSSTWTPRHRLVIYDLKSKKWSNSSQILPENYNYGTFTSNSDGFIYAFGSGNNADETWRYSPSQDTWKKIRSSPVTKNEGTVAVSVKKGELYLLGGDEKAYTFSFTI